MSTNEQRPFADLRGQGLLWLINRTVFHPHGCALALHFDEAGNATGWSVQGDGTEPWAYVMDDEEDARFRAAQAFFDQLRPGARLDDAEVTTARTALEDAADYRRDGGGPLECHDCTKEQRCDDHAADDAVAGMYDLLADKLQAPGAPDE